MRIEDTVLNEALITVNQFHDGMGSIKEYEQVVEQIAGGERLLQNRIPAEIAESRRMVSEISGMSKAVINVQEADTIADIAGEALNRVSPIITRMQKLAEKAAVTTDDGQRMDMDDEFKKLTQELYSIVDGASYKDVPIFDGAHSRDNGGLIMQSAGTGQVIAMYFEGPDKECLSASSLRTREEAGRAVEFLKGQMQVFSREKSGLKSCKKDISGSKSHLVDRIAALSDTEKRVQDMAEAKELCRQVAQQIQQEPNTASMAQRQGIKRENAMAALYE